MSAVIDAHNFFITTKCTLRCKNCLMSFPYCPNPRHTPKEQVFSEIREVAKMCELALLREEYSVAHADLIGGEPLLHPDILEIAQELSRHINVFPNFRVVTNATVLPPDNLLSFMKSVNESGTAFSFLLSNYGKHSVRFDEILEKLEKWEIPFRIDSYTGENQYFQGWVDIGGYPGHNRSREEATHLFVNCCVYKKFLCLPVWNGKIYPCAYTFGGEIREALFAPHGEVLDLFDDSITAEDRLLYVKKRIYSNEPFSGCYHCNGFGIPNQKRFPAAEQL